MKRKEIATFFIVVIVLVVFYTLFLKSGMNDWFSNNAYETLTRRVKELSIAGYVNDKYIDENSHLHETLVINNSGQSLRLIIPNDKSGLYAYIAIGDSIFKEKESMVCYVKRDGIYTRFEIDFGSN
ncbi:MAG: hypothetical protein AB7S69_04575 [Salinivirgaceae bacterium]